MQHNKYVFSYGLIVETVDEKVVLIQRKVPYSVQNYLMQYNLNNLSQFDKTHFEKNWFSKHLSFKMKIDYINYLENNNFEDKFDFPHGQLINNNPFKTACKEFNEETGYKFNHLIKVLGIERVSFIGLDGCFYLQTFFKILVKSLTKILNIQDDIYETRIVDIKFAKQLLAAQQTIKKDNKHKLLST